MKTLDLYSKLHAVAATDAQGFEPFEKDPELQFLTKLARDWGLDMKSVRRWLSSPEGKSQAPHARAYLDEAPSIVLKVEEALGRELPGTLVWMPSFGEFDGFARYDSGLHTVIFGVDFPGSDLNYLKALTAHELSHVYRDHAPEVWGHLGKPLTQISRKEYLEHATAQEHLVSEGLATLFSLALFPEIAPITHHYYEEPEWQWVENNSDAIHESILACLRGDQDVWSYYSPSRVAPGSPSRTQYYWAAKMLAKRVLDSKDPIRDIVALHEKNAAHFTEFQGN